MLLASATLSERGDGTLLIERSRNERGMECRSLRLRSASGIVECCSLSGVEMSGVMEVCSLRLRSASGVMERCSLRLRSASGEWNVARFGYAQRAGNGMSLIERSRNERSRNEHPYLYNAFHSCIPQVDVTSLFHHLSKLLF